MATVSSIPVLMVLLMVLATCQGCDTDSDPMCYLYPFYQQVEAALVNDSQSLHMLRQAFFPLQSPTIAIIVCITAEDNTVPKYCDTSSKEQPAFHRNGTNHSEVCWKFQWSSSALLASITADELLAFDNTFFTLFYSSLGPHSERNIKLHLQLGVLSCMPSRKEVSLVLTTFLSWIKAYTRAHGVPETWNEEDKGFVSARGGFWVIKGDGGNPADLYNHSHLIRVLLLAAFIFINLVVLFSLVKFAPEFYTKLKIRIDRFGQTYSIFWASVIVISMFNTTNMIIMIGSHVIGQHPKISVCMTNANYFACGFYHTNGMLADMRAAFLAKLIIFPCALVFEFLVAVCIRKDLAFPIPALFQKALCCCFCFCSSQTQSKAIQTFVLWNFMVFLQNLALSILPTAIVLIASPLIIIPQITLALSLFFTCVIAIAHLIPPKHTTRKSCMSTLLQFTYTLLFFGTVITILSFYLAMVTSGGTTTGVSGFLFQLLPSILLSALGYYMKQKFFNKSPEGIPTHHRLTQEYTGDTLPNECVQTTQYYTELL